jgi:SAM-dependent methyltransferase
MKSMLRILRKTRRRMYALRKFVPGLRDQHAIEAMVGPVGYWQELEEYQIHTLKENGLRPEHALLDLGCGPLQGGIPLIGYLEPANYTGVDIQPKHLAAAYRRIAEHGLAHKNPRLIHSTNLGDEHLDDHEFDYIWASQILYYFNDQQLKSLFAFVRRRLRSGGRFLGDFINPELFDSVYYPRCGFIRRNTDELRTIASSEGISARMLGKLEDFRYPQKLSLRSSLLFEFKIDHSRLDED